MTPLKLCKPYHYKGWLRGWLIDISDNGNQYLSHLHIRSPYSDVSSLKITLHISGPAMKHGISSGFSYFPMLPVLHLLVFRKHFFLLFIAVTGCLGNYSGPAPRQKKKTKKKKREVGAILFIGVGNESALLSIRLVILLLVSYCFVVRRIVSVVCSAVL